MLGLNTQFTAWQVISELMFPDPLSIPCPQAGYTI